MVYADRGCARELLGFYYRTEGLQGSLPSEASLGWLHLRAGFASKTEYEEWASSPEGIEMGAKGRPSRPQALSSSLSFRERVVQDLLRTRIIREPEMPPPKTKKPVFSKLSKPNVVSMSAFVGPRSVRPGSSSALARLLREAQKLRW